MPNPATVQAEKYQLLHLKDVEVTFKSKEPKYPVKVKVTSGEVARRSKEFEDNSLLRWDASIHIPPTSSLEVIVKESHAIKWRTKRGFATIRFEAEDIDKCNTVTKEDERGLISVKLNFESPVAAGVALRKGASDAVVGLEKKPVILEKLGKARKFVEVAKGFSDMLYGIHPAASAAVIAFNMLYERLEKQEKLHDDAAELIDDMSLLLPFTEVVEPSTLANEMAAAAIKDFLDLFREACESVIQYSSGSALGDLLSLQKPKIDQLKGDFTKVKNRYDWSIKTDVWRVNLKLEKIKDNETLKLLHVSSFGPAGKEYYRTDKCCLMGTRTSFLEQVSQWAEATSDRKLFWMYGSAGSGKTAIANSVARALDEQRLLVGCFFCRKDDPDLKDTSKVIPSLSAHLAVWHQPFSVKLLSALQGEEKNRLASKTLQEQFDLLIKGPALALSADEQNQSPHPLVIVIDALDECGESKGQRLQLAKILVQVSRLVPWLKLFVTSAPLPEFSRAFEQQSASLETLYLDQAADTTSDIVLYAKHRAQLIVEEFGLEPNWISEEQIDTLAQKVRGLFIRASTAFDFIASQVDVEQAVEVILSAPAAPETPEARLDPLAKTRQGAGSSLSNRQQASAVVGIPVPA